MEHRGTEQALRDLAQDGRTAVSLGVVTAIEEHDAWGYLLTVQLQPSGLVVQARPTMLGCGSSGAGIWVPFEVGAEVVVRMPDGDPNRAFAGHGPTSTPAKPPTGWSNDKIEIVHSGGLEVRSSQGSTVKKVVLEDLLNDLAAWVLEVDAAIVAGTATPSGATFALDLATAYRAAALETE